MANSISALDEYREDIEFMRNQNSCSNTELVKHLYDKYGIVTSEKSVRRAFKRWRKRDTQSSVKIKGDVVEITTPSTRLVTDPEELMRELGVNPDEWDISSVIVNRWGDVNDPSYQLKAQLKKKISDQLILPAVDIKYRHKGVFKKPRSGEPLLGFFASDFHAPFHDRKLLSLFYDWLHENKPHEGVIGGDLVDFPEISRHRHKPEWKATTQECVQSGFEILAEIRKISEETKLVFFPGNHDERIRNTIIDHNKDLIGLRPADRPDHPQSPSVWDLRNLFHLKELGIEYIDPDGTYEYALYQVSKKLGATHGWLAKKHSSESAKATLEDLGHSIILGHTHRRGFFYKTIYEIDGSPRDLVAVEAGCMCQLKKGLGYARGANWQQGYVTYSVWPDGTFNIEPAVFINGKLYWRNQVYE